MKVVVNTLPNGFVAKLPPKPYQRLIGRDLLLARLTGVLRDPDAAPVVSICGIGGIGKTALAYELAQRAAHTDLFVDVLWFSAKQAVFENRHTRIKRYASATLDELIDYIYGAIADRSHRTSPHDRREFLRTELKSKAYLLVLDNFEDFEDHKLVIDQLCEFLGPTRLIVTSRVQMESTCDIYHLDLGGLDEDYSLELINEEAQYRNVEAMMQADLSVLRRIHKQTGGMPLAIKLVVGEVHAGLDIHVVLSKLITAINEQELYRFIYFDLWHTLSESGQITLVSMPGFGSSVSAEMLYQVCKVSGVRRDEFEKALVELRSKSLVDRHYYSEVGESRYSIHPLTRNFVLSDLPDLFDSETRR